MPHLQESEGERERERQTDRPKQTEPGERMGRPEPILKTCVPFWWLDLSCFSDDGTFLCYWLREGEVHSFSFFYRVRVYVHCFFFFDWLNDFFNVCCSVVALSSETTRDCTWVDIRGRGRSSVDRSRGLRRESACEFCVPFFVFCVSIFVLVVNQGILCRRGATCCKRTDRTRKTEPRGIFWTYLKQKKGRFFVILQ